MLCDKYKEALTEAASSTALPDVLREHLETCAYCRASLVSQRTLFAAVDAGLHKAANAKARSSFHTNVKANLTALAVTHNPIPARALVCATGALALAAAFLSLPRGPQDKARPEAIIVPSKVPASAGGVELSLGPESKIRYSARGLRASEQRGFSSGASHEPEVLIQPDEEAFLKRFYVAVRDPAGEARAIVTEEQEIMLTPQAIAQIEVEDLRIEDLGRESELTQTGTK
jgi:hypothetical protein